MHSPTANDPACPFCPFADPDADFVAEHVHFCHPEQGSRIGRGNQDAEVMGPNGSRTWQPNIMQCPQDRGSVVTEIELASHLEVPVAEGSELDGPFSSHTDSLDVAMIAQKAGAFSHDFSEKESSSIMHGIYGEGGSRQGGVSQDLSRSTRHELNGMKCHSKTAQAERTKRLGRAELGPHVHERQMPFWLRKMLERGAKVTHTNQIAPDGTLRKLETVENEATDIIPILGRLCRADKSVTRAFLCSPKICQIFKLPREGGFCGYRNIQMLISYIRQSDLPGHDRLSGPLPTILQLQDMIEHAWDMGFNSSGREETGGIRGTRKFIGTSEAQALFLSLGIQCEACSIGSTQQLRAYDALLSKIASYFRQGSLGYTDEKVLITCLPPIYFQHQGHSLTIVGFEVRDNGSANLLVFDPMFKVPSGMKRSMGTGSRFRDPLHALKGYRRGISYLQKYQLFEILKLPLPVNPGDEMAGVK